MLRITAHRTLLRCMSSDAAAQAKVSVKTQALLDKLLRVDHAGEFGAVRIYQGQLAVLGKSNVGPVLSVSNVAGVPLLLSVSVISGLCFTLENA